MSDSASKHQWVLDILGIDIGRPQWQPAQAAALDPAQAKIGKSIKKGRFGEVHRLDTDQPGIPNLVMKTPLTAQYKAELEREEAFYQHLGDHPNIAKCFGMQTVEGQEGLVLELVEGRDMAGTMQVLEKLRTGNSFTLNEYGMTKQLSQEDFVGTLQYMTMQALTGLAHLEQMTVVHNDVRPDNILIDQLTGAVKIADFGISQPTGGAPGDRATPATYGSVSPDRTGADGMTPKHDMFGLGEAVRKQMERDQFRYLTGKSDAALGLDDLQAFGAPDASGAPKQALNPRPPGAAAVQPFAARLAPLLARAETAFVANSGYLKHYPEADDLRAAREDAQAALERLEAAAADPASGGAAELSMAMDEHLAELAEKLEAAEAVNARMASTRINPQGARHTDLRSRLDRLLADPFVAGTETASRLKARMAATQADDAGAMSGMDQELRAAEAALKRSGEFGAQTAYTRFVNVMMHPDPKERPSARELLAVIQSLDAMDEDQKAAALDRLDPVRPEPPGGGSSPLPLRFLAQRMGSDTRSREILRTVLTQAAAIDSQPAAVVPPAPPPPPMQPPPGSEPMEPQPPPAPEQLDQPPPRLPSWEELEQAKPYNG